MCGDLAGAALVSTDPGRADLGVRDPQPWPDGRLLTAAKYLRQQMRRLLAAGAITTAPFERRRRGIGGFTYQIQPGVWSGDIQRPTPGLPEAPGPGARSPST